MANANFSTSYVDRSISALNDTSSIVKAQTHLQSLGMNIGSSKPDGQWGRKSQEAAKEWQSTNGYEATGDITERQMSVLEHQANNPSIYNRIKLKTFYENFYREVLSGLDPVRRNTIVQAASHLGVKEHREPGAEEGTNSGPAIEQYAEADSRFPGQGAWCSLSQSWIIDQVEEAGGVNNSDFHQGNMRVHETRDQIRRDHPESLADLRGYEPQTSDIMLTTDDGGTGHASTVVASFDDGDGYSRIATIDGNLGDGMNLSVRYLYTYPDTGETVEIDEEGFIIDNREINIVDISRLPNYDKMNNNFNSSAEFIPTPSADPNFEPDIEQLAALQNILEEKIARSAPQPLPELVPVELSIDTTQTEVGSNVIVGNFTGSDAAQAGNSGQLNQAQEHGLNINNPANPMEAPAVATPLNIPNFGA